jgi:hypothetical protein
MVNRSLIWCLHGGTVQRTPTSVNWVLFHLVREKGTGATVFGHKTKHEMYNRYKSIVVMDLQVSNVFHMEVNNQLLVPQIRFNKNDTK